jgi:predicted  nucleic acid-binding Zn-ribbon protein
MTEEAALGALSRVELTDLEEQTLQVWREARLCQDLRLDVEALRAEQRSLSEAVNALRQEKARLEGQIVRARSASFWAAKQAENARSAVG